MAKKNITRGLTESTGYIRERTAFIQERPVEYQTCVMKSIYVHIRRKVDTVILGSFGLQPKICIWTEYRAWVAGSWHKNLLTYLDHLTWDTGHSVSLTLVWPMPLK